MCGGEPAGGECTGKPRMGGAVRAGGCGRGVWEGVPHESGVGGGRSAEWLRECVCEAGPSRPARDNLCPRPGAAVGTNVDPPPPPPPFWRARPPRPQIVCPRRGGGGGTNGAPPPAPSPFLEGAGEINSILECGSIAGRVEVVDPRGEVAWRDVPVAVLVGGGRAHGVGDDPGAEIGGGDHAVAVGVGEAGADARAAMTSQIAFSMATKVSVS